MDRPDSRTHLVVFSDDWGRHPSSCQHLVSHLVERYPTLWVNTIGTRSPRLSLEDAGKAAAKVVQWLRPPRSGQAIAQFPRAIPENLTVVTPRMWPGFRADWQRRFNAGQIARAVNHTMNDVWGQRIDGQQRVAITTLPITADLAGALEVDRWIYYCVDDFSVWPGLDAQVMQQMEREQVAKVDAIVAVSDTLIDRLNAMGRPDVSLLTHGIALSHWRAAAEASQTNDSTQGNGANPEWTRVPPPASWRSIDGPIFLFWGLIDRRIDTDWCRALARAMRANGGALVLVGPTQSPDPALAKLPGVRLPGPAAYDELPTLAAAADVLVMPYADLPVTRAMQPLKFKEYLATGKPVVARDLPATRPWADAADLLKDAEPFAKRCVERVERGLPESQRVARQRLSNETWAMKAATLERVILGNDD